MAIEIKTPYDHTPYDVFSDPDDPKVGVLTPDANRSQIMQQQVKVLKQHKQDIRKVNEAYDMLRNVAARLSWDIFLTTTLMRSTEIGDLVNQYKKPSVPEIKDPNWGAELEWSYQKPEEKIELLDRPVVRRTTYDEPSTAAGDIIFEA